jgi:VWFA-related protein
VRLNGKDGRLVVLCAVLGLPAAPGHAQPPSAAAQGPSFRGGVEIVVVEASVLDKAGATVRGLTPQDFRIEIGGKAREVVSADLIEHRPPAAGARDFDLTSNDLAGLGRTILLLVDQTSLRSESRAVLNRAERWLSTLSPTDRVAFVALPLSANTVDFTTDHAQVRKALGSAVVAPDARAPIVTIRNISVYEGLRIYNGDLFVRNEVIARECRGEERTCPTEIEMASRDIYLDSQFRVTAILGAFTSLMRSMRAMPGIKHVVLLSSGWPIDERTAASEVPVIGGEAALSNVIIHTFTSESWAMSAALSQPSQSMMQDQNLLMSSVEMLSGITGGLAARVIGDGEAAFKELDRTISSYYRLGIRPGPEDLDGKPKPISLKITRPGVSLRSYRKVLSATPAAPGLTSTDPTAALRAAVESPAVVTGLDLRATAYVLHGEASEPGSVRVILVGDVSRSAPGLATSLAVLYDQNGRPVGNEGQDLEITASRTRFQSALTVAPGVYRARIAVRDADGRVGSVERPVDARWQKAGDVETTGLALLVAAPTGNVAEPVLETVSTADRVIAQLSLRGAASDAVPGVAMEIGQGGASGAVLLRMNARVARTSAGTTLAQETIPVGLLPPGRYTIAAALPDTPARFSRSIVVEGAPAPTAAARTSAALLLARPPRFEVRDVLAPDVVAPILDRLARRPDAASASDAIQRVKRGPWPAEILVGPLQASPLAAAFIGGLGRLERGDLDGAAVSFRNALRAAPDFTPSILYLGACYAAGSRDREAAGAWQTALSRERELPLLSHLAIDAWLRAGRPDAAQALAADARKRWPADGTFVALNAQTALAAGRRDEGLALVSEVSSPEPSLLLMAMAVLYEAGRDQAPVWDAARDEAAMVKFRDAYARANGESLALVDAWMRKP